MAKKEFFLILDTETTINDHVFDFGAVVVDRHGEIQTQCAIVVNDFRDEELFHDRNAKGFWAKERLNARHAKYDVMLENGTRMMASANAINRWLEKVIGKYDPMLTAYNLAFDTNKCANSGIDLTGFTKRFCLWHTACEVFAKTKAYKQFAMDNLYFGEKTAKGNMTIKTNAEVMAHFVTGQFSEEPHTAIEDAIYYELPIMVAIVNKKKWKEKTNVPYSWRDYQVKEHYAAK